MNLSTAFGKTGMRGFLRVIPPGGVVVVAVWTGVACLPDDGPTAPTEQIVVSVLPDSAVLYVRDTLRFSALVYRAEGDHRVNWRAKHGTVDSTGTYQAPAYSTLDTVIAASVVDSTKLGSAAVVVVADQIAYMKFVELDESTGTTDIWSRNLDWDATAATRLTCSTNTGQSIPECSTTIRGQNIYPAYSPDGRKIAFWSNRDIGASSSAIYVMNPDGSDQTRLTPTSDGLSPFDPAWCANGKIYFKFWDHGENTTGIGKVDADGNNLHKLVEVPLGSRLFGGPACSPDGSRIAYADDNREIHVADHDGSNRRAVTEGWGPVWSRDGKGIFFVTGEIHYLDLETNAITQITHEMGALDPALSPDGNVLLFVGQQGWYNLYTQDLSNGDVTRLTFSETNADPAYRYPAWRPRP